MKKIDLLYVYHFSEDDTHAIMRLKTSILSLIGQDVNICVCNTSDHCIYDQIKHLTDIRYLHNPTHTKHNKPRTINIGVKKLIKTEYFLLSDIDLVYHPDYVESILKYADGINVRVTNVNHNCPINLVSPFYEDFIHTIGMVDPTGRASGGESRGNGLIKRSAFDKIGGYDEFYFGYGPEDIDFNIRMSIIQKTKFIDDNHMKTFHLFHPMTINDDVEQYRLNMLHYNQMLTRLGLVESDVH